MTITALGLLLVDPRLPTGGHAYSAAAEQAIEDGIIVDEADLARFLASRLGSSVLIEAHAAAIACEVARVDGDFRPAILALEAALDARISSLAARVVSRHQGEQYRRAVSRVLEASALEELAKCRRPGPHLPVAVGVAAANVGLKPQEAAVIAAYTSLAASATAALRLLGLDPFIVSTVLARLATDIDALATDAAIHVRDGVTELPAPVAPMLDYLLEEHGRRKDRLFAS